VSRQHDRGDLPPEVRIRMAEDDLDRVDVRFEDMDGAIKHARGNVEMLAKAVEAKHDMQLDKLESKVDRLEAKREVEMDELRKSTSEEIGGNRKVMVGVLLSTLGTAIAIVAAVLTMRGGG
jgi:hypothetical protein